MYGGRARRIELAKKAGIVLVCIIVIVFCVKKITTKKTYYDANAKYDYLNYYFTSNGYTCEDLTTSGARCSSNTQSSKSEFVRFNDGFTYLDAGDSYTINIYYERSTPVKNGIFLKTNNYALIGYQKKNYTCITKDNIIGELVSCVDDDGVALDSGTYLGLVEKSILTVSEALDYSGYDVNALIEDFNWVRVR